MARKTELYAIGIIMQDNRMLYVTSTGEKHTARWEDGKDAMLFTKDIAKDMCQGFAWNGIPTVPVLKLDYINLRNEVKEN